MKTLIALLMLLSTAATAGETTAPNGGKWEEYHALDHFSWSHYDDDLHIAIGFGMSYVIADTLVARAGMKPWEGALIGTLSSVAFAAFRESMLSTYTSKTDIKTWSGGAALGGLTFYAIHF